MSLVRIQSPLLTMRGVAQMVEQKNMCLVYYLVLKGEGIMKFDAKGILKSIDFRFDTEGTQIDIIFLEETR